MASARLQAERVHGEERPGASVAYTARCAFLTFQDQTRLQRHRMAWVLSRREVPDWSPLTEVRGLVVPPPGASGITVRPVRSVRSGHRRVVPSLPSSWRELLSHLSPTLRGLELQVDPVAQLARALILAHPVEPGWAACLPFDRPA